VRARVKRILARRYETGGIPRAAIYCLLSPRYGSLAERIPDKLRIVYVTVALALEELRTSDVRAHRIAISYRGERLTLFVGGCNDLDVLKSLFVENGYEDLHLAHEPEVIVDLGSHIGSSLVLFRMRYPRARLVGVEPHPALFRLLRANTAGMTDVAVRNVAVTGNDGSVPFFPWRDAWGSSLFRSGHAGEEIQVPALTLRTLLDGLGIRKIGLLKLNIEGAEMQVIASFDDWSCVDTLVVEWHGAYLDTAELEQALAILRPHFELEVEPVAMRPGDYAIIGMARGGGKSGPDLHPQR